MLHWQKALQLGLADQLHNTQMKFEGTEVLAKSLLQHQSNLQCNRSLIQAHSRGEGEGFREEDVVITEQSLGLHS